MSDRRLRRKPKSEQREAEQEETDILLFQIDQLFCLRSMGDARGNMEDIIRGIHRQLTELADDSPRTRMTRWCRDTSCATATTFVAAVVLIVFSVLLGLDVQHADTHSRHLAFQNMYDDLPGEVCIWNQTSFVGSLCQSATLGCAGHEGVPWDFSDYTSTGNITDALISCGVVQSYEINDRANEDNNGRYPMTNNTVLAKQLEQFYSSHQVSSAGNLYVGGNVRSYGQGQSYIMNSTTLRIDGSNNEDYIWLNLSQSLSTSACVNNAFPIPQNLSFFCAGNPWYFTAPYCRTYRCTEGVDVAFYSDFSNYMTIYQTIHRYDTIFGKMSYFQLTSLFAGFLGAAVAIVATFVAQIFSWPCPF